MAEPTPTSKPGPDYKLPPGSKYAKVFVPIESNPVVFTPLLRDLGVPAPVSFIDIFSLDPEVQPLPEKLLALVLAFPDTEQYKAKETAEEREFAKDQTKRWGRDAGSREGVVWFSQTIHNACGTYALLHSVLNGPGRERISPESTLADMLYQIKNMTARNNSGNNSSTRLEAVLEQSDALERAHTKAAQQGDTAPPELGEEVDHHYVAFVRSGGAMWELDGSREGPVVRVCGKKEGEKEEMLQAVDVEYVRRFMAEVEEGGGGEFALLGLVDEE